MTSKRATELPLTSERISTEAYTGFWEEAGERAKEPVQKWFGDWSISASEALSAAEDTGILPKGLTKEELQLAVGVTMLRTVEQALGLEGPGIMRGASASSEALSFIHRSILEGGTANDPKLYNVKPQPEALLRALVTTERWITDHSASLDSRLTPTPIAEMQLSRTLLPEFSRY